MWGKSPAICLWQLGRRDTQSTHNVVVIVPALVVNVDVCIHFSILLKHYTQIHRMGSFPFIDLLTHTSGNISYFIKILYS